VLRWSTQIHKWLALIVGLQVLGWVLGGLVMTAIPIERVRGEHRAARFQSDTLPTEGVVSWAAAATAAGVSPVEATLKSTLRGPVWQLKTADGQVTVRNALTGASMPPMPPAEVRQLAAAQYEGVAAPSEVDLLAAAPAETGRTGPLWRVRFDDEERSRLYLSPDTAEVVSRRSNVWSLYDAFWRIHILDFRTGENFNHPLLIALTALTLPVVITGLILLWIRLGRDLRRALGRRRASA
jgi:hypothetical protein